jgi:transcriptional regulator with XRE-family HTH domain
MEPHNHKPSARRSCPSKKRPGEHKIPRAYAAVGRFLGEARIRAHLTQQDVAAALGLLSAQHISNYECGIVLPSRRHLKTLVRLCRLNEEELLEVILGAEKDVLMRKLKLSKSKQHPRD